MSAGSGGGGLYLAHGLFSLPVNSVCLFVFVIRNLKSDILTVCVVQLDAEQGEKASSAERSCAQRSPTPSTSCVCHNQTESFFINHMHRRNRQQIVSTRGVLTMV